VELWHDGDANQRQRGQRRHRFRRSGGVGGAGVSNSSNSSRIGTLTNSGTIIGGDVFFYKPLSNNVVGAAGVSNSGTITTLTNNTGGMIRIAF